MVVFSPTIENRRNDDKDYCHYVRYRTYQDMTDGVWVPHFKPDNKLVAFHHVKPDDGYDIMWDKWYSGPEPKEGDACKWCGRKIRIFENE